MRRLSPSFPVSSSWASTASAAPSGGRGGGKPHSTVNYVFEHPYEWLFEYHEKVMEDMFKRGYKFNPMWQDPKYRGANAPRAEIDFYYIGQAIGRKYVYPEHDYKYLKECLDNLERKGIHIEV